MPDVSSIKGTALVTGASSGIGAVYADRLARRGYDLILVARNKARLETLATRLEKETNRTVSVIAADLGHKDDLKRVEAELRNNSRIDVLVNNAGLGHALPLLASDVDKMEDMIRLNATSLMRLSYAAAPGFAARGKGTVINIASVVALQPELLNGVYAGSKAFVLAFSQSLHSELADKGVRVQAVLPGATATEFWDGTGRALSDLPAEIVMPVEDMVDAALTGLDQGELVTIPALADAGLWNAYDGARRAMFSKLSNRHAAARYAVATHERS
jgi:short-subunit dehydrogenase